MALGPAEVAHGPMFIGFVFNVFLYGIMITQVYLYFTAYKQDKMWLKLFVIFLLAADTANTIFDAAYLYRALIVHFGEDSFLATADWLFETDPALTGIIAGAVQLFFAWRLRVLTHSWALASIVVLGALSGLAGAVATSFEVGKIPQFVNFRDFKGVVIMWLVSESVTDIIITSILVWYLLQKHKTGFKESDYMVDRIIRITVQTGLVTSIAATLDLILFLAFPNGTHLIFNFPLCKLYSNSLMSSLNARGGWRYGSSKNEHTTTEVTSATPQASLLQMRSGDGAGTGTGILHALGHALGGAPTVPAVPAPGDAPRLPKRAAWGPLRRFSTGTYHHYARGEPVDAAIDAGASTPSHSRSLGAGLLRATSLSRPGTARAGPGVYVCVESCQQQDALAAQPVLRSASARAHSGGGGLRVARALSVCVSVGSDAESKKVPEEDKRSSVGKDVDVELGLPGGG